MAFTFAQKSNIRKSVQYNFTANTTKDAVIATAVQKLIKSKVKRIDNRQPGQDYKVISRGVTLE